MQRITFVLILSTILNVEMLVKVMHSANRCFFTTFVLGEIPKMGTIVCGGELLIPLVFVIEIFNELFYITDMQNFNTHY